MLMKIYRIHPFTRQGHVMEIPVTEEQLRRWEAGELIQNAMPSLTPGQREFIKTGLLESDFEAMRG